MQRFFTVCFLLLSWGVIRAQNSQRFPQDFLGVYKGTLVINSAKGTQTIPMEFHLTPTDSSTTVFTYQLVYNGQPRNYTLIEKDKTKGLYEIDENNGIVLPANYVANTLYSFFEVQGNLLTTRLSFTNNSLDFEILFTAVKNKTTTGKGTKEIPFVYGYPISVVQRAVLVK
ncbi:hypothetical protein ACQY1Q_15000 [Tenacibaculum sp. TC6]|uniref:hypothetical protein n=1 Tax=Tenacibaculum sp. TC6 TaxID=3423223 RepID=UPI003D363B9E